MSLFFRRRSGRTAPRVRRGVFFRALLFWRPKNRRRHRLVRPVPSERAKTPPRSLWSLVAALLTYVGLLALLGAAIVLGRFYLLHSPRFAVAQVAISPTRHVTAERLRMLSGVSLGQNLISLSTAEVAERLRKEPWLRHIHVEKRLPSTLRIVVEEFEPAALAALDSLYMITADGEVFRRAKPSDYVGSLPIVTGVGRAAYLLDRDWAQSELRRGLHALSLYQKYEGRPVVREVHVDQITGITFSTASGATIRLGQGRDEELLRRLNRFDAVWQTLQKQGDSAQLLLLDNHAHPDHITVRLSQKPVSREP